MTQSREDIVKKLSVTTTSKNRLSHLQESIESFIALVGLETIVVDYGCEQGGFQCLKENHPGVKGIHVTVYSGWCLARARNVGAQGANGEWLLFLDVDIKPRAMLMSWISSNCIVGSFYMSVKGGCPGTMLCSNSAYEKIAGYDEIFRGWGGEDIDSR